MALNPPCRKTPVGCSRNPVVRHFVLLWIMSTISGGTSPWSYYEVMCRSLCFPGFARIGCSRLFVDAKYNRKRLRHRHSKSSLLPFTLKVLTTFSGSRSDWLEREKQQRRLQMMSYSVKDPWVDFLSDVRDCVLIFPK